MYLRTTCRKNRDGSIVEYHSLAHNQWNKEKRRSEVQVIHNFGRADQLDREVLVRLCRSIARVCGLEVRDPLTEGVAMEAGGASPEACIRLINTTNLGLPWVAEALWERLGIGPTLRQMAARERMTVPYERALLAMAANRLSEPLSKLGLWEEWLPTVYLPDCWELKLPQLYEAMDLLWRHAAEVEETVFFHTANLFNLEVDVIFYDLTTASFSVDEEDPDEPDGDPSLRKWGRNSEGNWSVQVVIALAVTHEGLPVRSWVFPGNTPGANTVRRIRDDLRGWKLGRCLFVADAGLNSEENRRWLSRGGGRYLLAVPAANVKEVKEEVLSRPGRYKTVADNLRVKEVKVGEGVRSRRYFVCYNPAQAKRQREHREKVVAELEETLSRHRGSEATAKWAMELLTSRRTGRYLAVDEKGRVFIDRGKDRQAARFDGKWVLITNDDTLECEDAASGYKALMVIERCFRSLKSAQMAVTPMHHWLPRRIEAHVKICVLALLIQRVAELECGQPWRRIRRALSRLQLTQYHGERHRFFQRNELPSDVGRILKALKIQTPKLVMGIEPLP